MTFAWMVSRVILLVAMAALGPVSGVPAMETLTPTLLATATRKIVTQFQLTAMTGITVEFELCIFRSGKFMTI